MTDLWHGRMQLYNRPTDDSHRVELVISHVITVADWDILLKTVGLKAQSVCKAHNQSSKTAGRNTVNRLVLHDYINYAIN